MSAEPEGLVPAMLRAIREDIGGVNAKLDATKAELKADVQSLRADVASDLVVIEAKNDAQHKQTREQIVGLRRTVVEYHSAVIGHGMIISEREARVRRMEQHLNLPSICSN